MAGLAYGRPTREGASRAKAPRPIEEWRIVVKDRYPSYIDWSTYEKIRTVIRDNRAEYMRTKTRGAPRDGDLLLHGITWCARCGHKMYVRYKGGGEYVCNHLYFPHQRRPAYMSAHIRAARIDEAVADAFPDKRWRPPSLTHCREHAALSSRWIPLCVPVRIVSSRRPGSGMPPPWQNGSSIRFDPDNRLVAAELRNAGGKQL